MFDRILYLQHKGGEYLSINISGISNDRTIIWETINKAGELLIRPSTTNNVALQILDSKLSKEEMEQLTIWLQEMKENISRLAIIGARFRNKVILNKFLSKKKTPISVKYIYDWDTAKDWLVGSLRR